MFKLGFLGGGIGSIAGKVHLIASYMDRRFDVVGGIFNRDNKKSVLSAKEYNLKNFSGIREMEKEVDIVVILTPTPMHFKNIMQVEKPVIIDKPLCSNYLEAKKILTEKKNIVVTYNYTGYPLIREAKKIIKNGVIGKIIKAKFFMSQESFLKPFKPGYPQEWRKKDGAIPNLLLDLGMHIFHLAYFLIGDFEILFKKLNNFSALKVVDDCEIIAKTSNNAVVSFSCSKIMLGELNNFGFEIYGEKGSLKWYQNNCEELLLTKDNEIKKINRNNAIFEANKSRYNRMVPGHPSGYLEAFANYYCDIFDYFNSGNSEFIDNIDVSVEFLRKIDDTF